MPDLNDLARRLSAVSAAFNPKGLDSISDALTDTADTSIRGAPKPNYYKWPGAVFATIRRRGVVAATGREWPVADRGRRPGLHGVTPALRTWTNATNTAAADLAQAARREIDDRVREALNG